MFPQSTHLSVLIADSLSVVGVLLASEFPSFAFPQLNDIYEAKIFRVMAVLLGTYVATRILLVLLGKFYRPSARPYSDPLLNLDAKRIETLQAILRNTISLVMILAAIFILLSELGVNIAPLVAWASIAGVAAGLGAQNIMRDLYYGFFILLENQFGIGDTIQIGDSIGEVEGMTLRTISLRDQEGRVHVIPNGEASRVIIYTQGWSMMNLNLELAYQTNLDEAVKVIETLNKKFYKANKELLIEQPRCLGVESLTGKGVILRVSAKAQPQKQWEASRQYRKAVKEVLDDAGILLAAS